jgi:hypothetical protein
MPTERRVLAKLVRPCVGTTRGVFELADGREVEVDGMLRFDTLNAPRKGEKALVVIDDRGEALRWEPYAGTYLRRAVDS